MILKTIVRNRKDQEDALRTASTSLGRISFSSAYNSHHDPEFKDIIDFDELHKIQMKISNWLNSWEKRLKEIEMKSGFMRIEATFKGIDGSFGYETGKTYELILLNKGAMAVSRGDGSGFCEYQSISAFLKNWTDIKDK